MTCTLLCVAWMDGGGLASRAGSQRPCGVEEYAIVFGIPSMLSLLARGNVCARLCADFYSQFIVASFKELRFACAIAERAGVAPLWYWLRV